MAGEKEERVGESGDSHPLLDLGGGPCWPVSCLESPASFPAWSARRHFIWQTDDCRFSRKEEQRDSIVLV